MCLIKSVALLRAHVFPQKMYLSFFYALICELCFLLGMFVLEICCICCGVVSDSSVFQLKIIIGFCP